MTYLDEILKDWLNTLKAERDRANAALDRATPYAGSPIQIDPALIEQVHNWDLRPKSSP